MLCFVAGGLLLQIVGAVDIQTAKNVFGLGALQTIGHLFGLVGHYELFTIKVRSHAWFPRQERIVLALCHTDNFVLLARLILRLWAATVVAFNSAATSSRCGVSVSLCGCALRLSGNSAGSPWDVIQDDSDEKGRSWQHRRA